MTKQEILNGLVEERYATNDWFATPEPEPDPTWTPTMQLMFEERQRVLAEMGDEDEGAEVHDHVDSVERASDDEAV